MQAEKANSGRPQPIDYFFPPLHCMLSLLHILIFLRNTRSGELVPMSLRPPGGGGVPCRLAMRDVQHCTVLRIVFVFGTVLTLYVSLFSGGLLMADRPGALTQAPIRNHAGGTDGNWEPLLANSPVGMQQGKYAIKQAFSSSTKQATLSIINK